MFNIKRLSGSESVVPGLRHFRKQGGIGMQPPDISTLKNVSNLQVDRLLDSAIDDTDDVFRSTACDVGFDDASKAFGRKTY